MMNSAYRTQVILGVRCPKCRRGPAHWCRDECGKCIAPHVERSREAMKQTVGALMSPPMSPMSPTSATSPATPKRVA